MFFLSNVYVPCFNFRNNKRNPKDFNIYFVKCLFHRVNTTVKKTKKTSEQTTGCWVRIFLELFSFSVEIKQKSIWVHATCKLDETLMYILDNSDHYKKVIMCRINIRLDVCCKLIHFCEVMACIVNYNIIILRVQ